MDIETIWRLLSLTCTQLRDGDLGGAEKEASILSYGLIPWVLMYLALFLDFVIRLQETRADFERQAREDSTSVRSMIRRRERGLRDVAWICSKSECNRLYRRPGDNGQVSFSTTSRWKGSFNSQSGKGGSAHGLAKAERIYLGSNEDWIIVDHFEDSHIHEEA